MVSDEVSVYHLLTCAGIAISVSRGFLSLLSLAVKQVFLQCCLYW